MPSLKYNDALFGSIVKKNNSKLLYYIWIMTQNFQKTTQN